MASNNVLLLLFCLYWITDILFYFVCKPCADFSYLLYMLRVKVMHLQLQLLVLSRYFSSSPEDNFLLQTYFVTHASLLLLLLLLFFVTLLFILWFPSRIQCSPCFQFTPDSALDTCRWCCWFHPERTKIATSVTWALLWRSYCSILHCKYKEWTISR